MRFPDMTVFIFGVKVAAFDLKVVFLVPAVKLL